MKQYPLPLFFYLPKKIIFYDALLMGTDTDTDPEIGYDSTLTIVYTINDLSCITFITRVAHQCDSADYKKGFFALLKLI